MTRARELARLGNENVLSVEDDSLEVGINSTKPTSALDVAGQLNVGTAIKAGVAGVITATEFSGTTGTFSGNVSVGGTLTYEDVTNIDSVGIITAQTGLRVTAGGLVVTAGVTTITDDLKVNSTLTATEGINVTAGVTTIAGTSTFAKATTVNATLTASEGINVSAGVGTFAGNVSIADKIIHTGDTNTALRFPAADTFTVETGGSERLRVDSSGNIGIGTASASERLEVYPDANRALIFRDKGSTTYGMEIFNNSGNTGGEIHITAASAGAVVINRSGSETARFNGSGQLLIGTTTEGDTAADNLTIADSGASGITIRSGTTSTGNVYFSDATSGSGEYDGYIQYSQADQNMIFGTGGGNEALRIQSTGKIANDGKSASSFGSPDLLIAGIGTAHNIVCMQNSSSTGDCASIGFRVAGESGGDYTKVGIFAQRTAVGQGWNNLDLIFAHNSVENSGQVMVADEKFRFSSSSDLTITSIEAGATGPTLKLFHNSSTPADNDIISVISMSGDDDAGNETEYSSIYTKVTDVSNGSETGHISFKTRALGASNEILRLAGRGSASAPSYTTDDHNGIILDVYNTGNPYPRYMNFIAKSAGDTDSNIAFWTEAVGGSPTEKLRIGAKGEIKFKNSTITERMHYDSGGGIQSNYNHDVITYGMVWYGATNPVAAWTMNIRGDGSTAFNDLMDNNTTTTFTQIAASSNTSYYMTAFKIDGTTQSVEWAGGSAPSAATGSGYDSYVITIFKSASNTYKCFGNFTNFDN
jgi:hypothetical protein